MSDKDYKEGKSVIQGAIEKFEEQLQDNNNAEYNWLDKCEEFFKKLRDIDKNFVESDVIGKQIILQWIDARFIRKDGEWAVQLGEPFNCYLNPPKSKKSIRNAKMSCLITKTDSLTQEQLNWLQRLEAVARFFAFEKGAYCPNLRLEERMANETDEWVMA